MKSDVITGEVWHRLDYIVIVETESVLIVVSCFGSIAKLTQRRAETASNNKANEVANKDVPEQQESQTIKRSSPEAESLPNKDESVGQIENRNDESDEGVGEEQLSEDEQIEHLKELVQFLYVFVLGKQAIMFTSRLSQLLTSEREGSIRMNWEI